MNNSMRSILIVAVLLVIVTIFSFKERTASTPDAYTPRASTTPISSSSTPNQPGQQKTPQQGTCYVGGCSGQLCGDEPGLASSCEYKEEFACYKNARCERQTNGSCGWTETQELKICLTGKVLIQ